MNSEHQGEQIEENGMWSKERGDVKEMVRRNSHVFRILFQEQKRMKIAVDSVLLVRFGLRLVRKYEKGETDVNQCRMKTVALNSEEQN